MQYFYTVFRFGKLLMKQGELWEINLGQCIILNSNTVGKLELKIGFVGEKVLNACRESLNIVFK